MSAQNVALLRMAGRLVDVSGRSGQAHFEEQIRGAWSSAIHDIPRHLAGDPALAERFAQQLAAAASKSQHATMLFALIDDGGKDTIVGEFFQNAELEQLAQLGAANPDILRLLARVSGAEADSLPPSGEVHTAPLIEFGLASVAVPAGLPAAGSAVVTETHVFPGAWEGPDSPGMLRDLVRIHEALTRTGSRKPLERYGQPQIQLWLASQPAGPGQVIAGPTEAAPSAAAPASNTPAIVVASPSAPSSSVPSAVAVPSARPAVPAPPSAAAPVVPVAAPRAAAPVASTAVAKPAPKPVAVTPAPAQARPATPAAGASRQAAGRHTEQPAMKPYVYAEAGQSSEGSKRTMMMAGVGAVVVLLAVGSYFLAAGPSAKKFVPPSTSPEATLTPSATPRQTAAPAANTTATASPAASNTNTATRTGSPKTVNTGARPGTTGTAPTLPSPATAAAASASPAAAPAPVAAVPVPDNGNRRAAALDALGLQGQEQEDKRRNAMKALTGQ